MPAKRIRDIVGRDAIALLKKDHQKVKSLLKKLEKSKNREVRRNLFQQIDHDLQAHTEIEEEFFYPAFQSAVKNGGKQKLYYEAIEEHHVVDLILPELRTSDLRSETFAAKVKVLKDVVEHHIEEEETQMFPAARKAMSAGRLRELGIKIAQRQDQVAAGMWDRALAVLNPFARRTTRTMPTSVVRTATKRRAA